jgi:hypothetical protein
MPGGKERDRKTGIQRGRKTGRGGGRGHAGTPRNTTDGENSGVINPVCSLVSVDIRWVGCEPTTHAHKFPQRHNRWRELQG